jgi:hypothetical protein
MLLSPVCNGGDGALGVKGSLPIVNGECTGVGMLK